MLVSFISGADVYTRRDGKTIIAQFIFMIPWGSTFYSPLLLFSASSRSKEMGDGFYQTDVGAFSAALLCVFRRT